MSDPFSIGLDSLFATAMAIDVLYTPQGGQAVAVRALLAEPDTDVVIGGQAKLTDHKRVLEIRKSELVAASKDDVIEIPRGSGQNFRVMQALSRDTDRLLWRIEAASA
ncbi:MAG TPA: hypothetical protein VGM17_02285 [Rhizomicrobium sp.]|jgi:hypothetical protein